MLAVASETLSAGPGLSLGLAVNLRSRAHTRRPVQANLIHCPGGLPVTTLLGGRGPAYGRG